MSEFEFTFSVMQLKYYFISLISMFLGDIFSESPYSLLSCDCHTQMKRNTASVLGPMWYVIALIVLSFIVMLLSLVLSRMQAITLLLWF